MNSIYFNSEHTIRFRYAERLAPESIGELAKTLQCAAASGRKINITGGTHTINNITTTEDTLVGLERLQGYNDYLSVDRANRTGTVGGGMLLRDAIDGFNEHGLHFPILPGWFGQTVAGAIATGSHGSSMADGTLSDSVLEIEALTASGKIIHLTERDEELKAWRTHLGQLGVVLKVKFQLTDAFYLHCKTDRYDCAETGFQAFHESLRKWQRNESPYTEYLWFPYLGDKGCALVRTLHKSNCEIPNKEALEYEKGGMRKDRNFVRNAALDRTALLLSRSFLSHPKGYKNIYSDQLVRMFLEDNEVNDRSFRLFCVSQFTEPNRNKSLHLTLNSETAFDVKHIGPVFRGISDTLDRYYKKDIVINRPFLQFRAVNSSDKTWLGPNQGRKSIYFSSYISGAVLHNRQIPLVQDIEKITDAHGARPHWGKFRYLGQDNGFLDTYPHYDQFQEYRKHIDPCGLFHDGSNMFSDLNFFRKFQAPIRPIPQMTKAAYTKTHFLGGKSADLVCQAGK